LGELNVKVRFSVKTDTGRKRKNNEDNYCVDESFGLFAVLDGLGGHRSGEVASKLAADTILKGIRDVKKFGLSALVGEYDDTLSLEANQLVSTIRLANQVIYQSANERAEYKGMSSTVAGLLAIDGRVVTAHVGDSRIYLLRNNSIERISEDHSFVQEQIQRGILTPEEASKSELKNIVTRALGAAESVQVGVDEFAIMENDSLLLCSDGLTDMLKDEDIVQIYSQQGGDPERTCTSLVDIANERGGHDNITVLIVNFQNVKKKGGILKLFKSLWRR
jgi:serine/threonine protein phosphatase PrpC